MTIQTISQIFLIGLAALAFIPFCIKFPFQVIGGVIGGGVGVLIPFLCSEFYVWRGGDPTAAGAFSFFPILTLPLGIVIGVILASLVRKRRRSDEDKV